MKNNRISFRLSDEKYSQVKKLAEKTGASISSIVCLAINEYFEKDKDTTAAVKAPEILSGCLRCQKEGIGCAERVEKCKNEAIEYDPFSLGIKEIYPRSCIVEWFGQKYV